MFYKDFWLKLKGIITKLGRSNLFGDYDGYSFEPGEISGSIRISKIACPSGMETFLVFINGIFSSLVVCKKDEVFMLEEYRIKRCFGQIQHHYDAEGKLVFAAKVLAPDILVACDSRPDNSIDPLEEGHKVLALSEIDRFLEAAIRRVSLIGT